MVLIRNTNILVDDFQYAKRNEIFKKYIYFLTHLHTGSSNRRSLPGFGQLLPCGAHLLFRRNKACASAEVPEIDRHDPRPRTEQRTRVGSQRGNTL